MNTTTLQITVPRSDVSLLKRIISGMGWTASTVTARKKSGIQKGLDDIKSGNVYHAKDSADLVKQIYSDLF